MGDLSICVQGSRVLAAAIQPHSKTTPLPLFSHDPFYDFPAKSSSISLSFVAILPDLSAGFSLSPPAAWWGGSAEALARFSLSVSSALRSFVFASSSSLSPRLNGSLSSASGCGATEVSGCHFLILFAPGDGCRFGWWYSASTSSTGPD